MARTTMLLLIEHVLLYVPFIADDFVPVVYVRGRCVYNNISDVANEEIPAFYTW